MQYDTDFGRIVFYPDACIEGELTISRLYVKPAHRGHHAGYALLDMAKQYAKENGFRSIGLEVWPFEALGRLEEISMTKALIKYYSAYGFKSMKSNNARMKMKL